MKKILYVVIAGATVSLLLLQVQFGGTARTQAAAITQGANVVVRVPSLREPVEITGMQVGGNHVAFGRPFAGDESWVNALSLRVKNTSGKVITELRMSLNFEAGSVNPRRINIPLTYSQPIRPEQTVQVSAPTDSVASLRDLLAKQGVTANFRKGELRAQIAKFQGGSIWVKGVILGPRDPRTGRRKRM